MYVPLFMGCFENLGSCHFHETLFLKIPTSPSLPALWQLCLAETLQDYPQVTGGRYKMCVEVPVQKTMFRLLPAPLQSGAEISVSAILFTQGINEQQTIADRLVRWLRDFPSISVPGNQVWRQHSAGPD